MLKAPVFIRNALFAALMVVLGVVAGETFAPAPAVASSCDFSVCEAGESCAASSMPETCEVIGHSQDVCETTPCGDDDEGPGPVE